MNPVNGYACAVNGAIRADTVAPSELSAKINGLTHLFGVVVTQYHSLKWITECWAKLTSESENVLAIVPVAITSRVSEAAKK